VNFFARQDEARRLSRRLIVLFAIAVAAVVVAVDFVVFTVLASLHPASGGFALPTREWIFAHPGVAATTTLSVLGVIGLSSLYKTSMLAAGGGAVARSLGGVRVSPDTIDPDERRLLNVVEEMAIASGAPMPEVYLLEQESGLNAFAAGHNPSNAAIAVTRGALVTLNRAELQGVIAHEFSHILNGDMRLNLRLMGLLFGLLAIAVVARTVLRVGGRGRSRRGGVAAIVLAALAVLAIGYIGLFFGRLIQAAVSRTRESLADASAVQFTRDPGGLKGALMKIGATGGSRIAHPESEEVAHMLFAPGMRRLFATHPPLIERIKAIDPHFDLRDIDTLRARLIADSRVRQDETAPLEPPSQLRAAGPGQFAALPPAAGAAALVGNPGLAHMRLARELRETAPPAIVKAAAHPASARALLIALAMDPHTDAREKRRAYVVRCLPSAASAVEALQAQVDALEPEQRLPALLRASPALMQLTREERMQLMSALNGMLQVQGRTSLHSYVLRKVAQVHLRDEIEPTARVRMLRLSEVQNDAHVLLSVLARHGHAEEAAARRAYEIGMHHLYPRNRPAYASLDQWASALDLALSRLDRLAPPAREQLLEAMVRTVTHDEQLTIGEAELLRAVCAALHCPLPPLIAARSSAPPVSQTRQNLSKR